MSSTTPRLGLTKPDGSDQFDRTVLNANSDKLDAYPGFFVCTSTTRPVWTSAQKGQFISETDTRRILQWDGAVFHDVQSASPSWFIGYSPGSTLTISSNQVVQLTLGTITLKRPATIATITVVNLKQMRYNSFLCSFTPLIDNGYVGGLGGTNANVNQWHTYGAEGNWNDYRVVPALGMKSLPAGNHNIGIRLASGQGTGSFVRASVLAFMVNSTDV